MVYSEAFEMGFTDYMTGLITNPFCALTDEGKAWFAGWNQAYLDELVLEKFS